MKQSKQKIIWSPYQKAIFNNIAEGTGHAIIEARAGSSKTTSIIESLKYVPKGKKVLLLAFNKIIQEELKSRVPSSITNVYTFHALGFKAIRQRFGNVELDDSKVFKITKDITNTKDYDLISNLCDTIAFCKYGLLDLPKQIDYIIDNFDIDTCDLERNDFIKLVIQILAKDKEDTSVVDFNDMCWFSYVYNLNLGYFDYVFTDECFPYNQCISTDTGKEKIGILYKKFKKGYKVPLVLSYNDIENKFEYCKITNAWDRGIRNLIEVRCGKRLIRCTDNHKILTKNGWIEAGKITPGTLIKTTSPINTKNLSQSEGHVQYALNDDQYQIILGSFLGDGNVQKLRDHKYRTKIIHGEKQKDYCEWKASMFSSQVSFIKENGFSKKPAYVFNTKSFVLENNLPKNKSTCPQWVLNDLDVRGLAIWIMDDGSIHNHSMNIWTCSFDKKSQNRMVKKLQSFGISCRVASYFSKKKQKSFNFIMISVAGTFKLIELIKPYIHKNIKYKIDNKEIALEDCYHWNNKFQPFGYTVVTSVLPTDKYENVYDIEVEKNHNFIACSSQASKSNSGLIVHNCQDLNKSQLFMAKRACAATGRLIICRDELQQIYGWRMADNSIIDEIKNQPTTTTLPLPISYRCPKKVIELAQKWATDITCPEDAPEGEVINISLNEMYKKATPGCFILSRTNAPLISVCMHFIRNNQKANIKGRDVGKQLSSLIKRSKKKNISGFLTWLESWKTREIKKLESKNLKTDSVLDRYECLINLCDECKSLSEVSNKIVELFNDTDEKNIIILSTVHRCKGRERENVFILRYTFKVWLDNCHFMEKPSECMNIAYVAATRSKDKLYIVDKWK